MKSFFLALMLAIASLGTIQAQITAPAVEARPDTDPKYLMGAVPVVDNHAVLFRTIEVNPELSEDKVMQIMDEWLLRCMKDERVRYNQRLEQPAAQIMQQMVALELTFSKSFIAHDFADLSYVLVLDASVKGKVVMSMERIAFKYNEGGKMTKYTAEELIADPIAINKKGKIIYGYKKFRMKTIDLMDELAVSLQKELK